MPSFSVWRGVKALSFSASFSFSSSSSINLVLIRIGVEDENEEEDENEFSPALVSDPNPPRSSRQLEWKIST